MELHSEAPKDGEDEDNGPVITGVGKEALEGSSEVMIYVTCAQNTTFSLSLPGNKTTLPCERGKAAYTTMSFEDRNPKPNYGYRFSVQTPVSVKYSLIVSPMK